MSGFGPSSGRLVEACESSESRLVTKTKSSPPVIGALASVAAALGMLYGTTLVWDKQELLGAIVLASTVALAALAIVLAVRTSRTES